MNKILVTLLLSYFFIGCESMNQNAEITPQECKKMGKIYSEEEYLNYRSGEYEIKKTCK